MKIIGSTILIIIGFMATIMLLTRSPALMLLLLIIGAILLKLMKPSLKGYLGEWYVNYKLKRLGDMYTVFHDLYVPTINGKTTQVDHIVTSPFGIYVIETKNYSGWIYGKEYQKYWTQVLYKRKERLYNPIRQNYGHVRAVTKFLQLNEGKLHSIIVFSTKAKLKVKGHFTSAHVTTIPKLMKVIKSFDHYIISDYELKKINKTLENLKIKGKKERYFIKKNHRKEVRRKRKFS
nr:nuclease-related domain-containing protein [Lottiidibacillus patelloidae]